MAVYQPSMIDLRDSPSWQEGVGNLLMKIANAYSQKKKKDALSARVSEARKQGQRVKETYDEQGNPSYAIEEPKEQSFNDLLEMMKYKEAMKYDTDKGIDFANMPDEVKKMLGVYIEPKETSINSFLEMLGGFRSPEQVLPKEQVAGIKNRIAPLSLGEAEGGEVLTAPSATYKEGGIYSPQGEAIGEYLPGYEPKPAPSAVSSSDIADFMRQFVGKQAGISPEEVSKTVWSKKLGLKEISDTEIKQNDLQNAAQRIANGENSGNIIRNIIMRYPNLSFDTINNLRALTPKTDEELRNKVIQGLKESGMAVTENNIVKGTEILRRRGR